MDTTTILASIRDRRKELKISQKRMGEIAAISREHYSRLEKGSETISLRRLLRICGGLGLEIIVRPGSGRPTLEDLDDLFPKEE